MDTSQKFSIQVGDVHVSVVRLDCFLFIVLYHFHLSKHKNVSVYNIVQRKIGRSGV